MIKRVVAALALVAAAMCMTAPANADAIVVSSCGTLSSALSPGFGTHPEYMDVNGNLCTAASVTASVTGFQPNGSYGTQLSVSGVSAEEALPSGAAVAVENVGANTAYVNLGTSSSVTATTSEQAVPANGGGCVLTVGSNTNIAAITASSTTALNVIGGTGLGNYCWGGTGSVSATNPAAGATASAVPSDASYGGLNVGGTLRGQTGVNPTGTVYAGQTDVASIAGNSTTTVANGTQGVGVVTSSSSSVASSKVSTSAAASSLVIKNAAGNLYGVTVAIGATSGYLMIFDATSAPVDGAVTPDYCVPVISNGTNGGVAIQWDAPRVFSTGITAVFSTTGCFTKTASNAGFISGEYK